MSKKQKCTQIYQAQCLMILLIHSMILIFKNLKKIKKYTEFSVYTNVGVHAKKTRQIQCNSDNINSEDMLMIRRCSSLFDSPFRLAYCQSS